MAEGNVKNLLDQMNKAQAQLTKAKENIAGSILDIADSLDACVVQATGIGGKISQMTPPHFQAQIDKLTAIADQVTKIVDGILTADGQSSLESLRDLITSMPVKDTMPETAEQRRAQRSGSVNLTPDTSGGPQSATRESYYGRGGLQWDRLNESQIFEARDDFGALSAWARTEKPVEQYDYRRRIQEAVDDDALEDLGTSLRESMDGRGHFDWKAMNSPLGSMDNNRMDFETLRDTGRDGTNLSQVNMVG